MFNYGLSRCLAVFSLAHPVCLFDNEKARCCRATSGSPASCGVSESVRSFFCEIRINGRLNIEFHVGVCVCVPVCATMAAR